MTEEHEVIPVTPVTVQEPVPAGDAPFVGPETVAVKVNVEPITAVDEFGVTTTDTVDFATTVSLSEFVEPLAAL